MPSEIKAAIKFPESNRSGPEELSPDFKMNINANTPQIISQNRNQRFTA